MEQQAKLVQRDLKLRPHVQPLPFAVHPMPSLAKGLGWGDPAIINLKRGWTGLLGLWGMSKDRELRMREGSLSRDRRSPRFTLCPCAGPHEHHCLPPLPTPVQGWEGERSPVGT